jgi:mitochondrial fission protein ELM1
MDRPPRTWVLADDRPGNVNQALAVAEALAWPFLIKAIRYGPLARLPNELLGGSVLGLTAAARAGLKPPWPELVIAAGRRTAPVARWLKRRQPAAFLVQLMWPGSTRGLDLVAVPAHDALRGRPEVLRTHGAPHRITPERLAEAASALAPRVAQLPRPRIACLVGGSTRAVPFTVTDALTLARQASALARSRAGSLLITTSRRTDATCAAALASAIDAPRLLYRWSPRSAGSDNPYIGLLGAADAIIVTADSASMCAEACASGRPVFLFRPAAGASAKLTRLHAALEAAGYLRPLGAAWPERCPPPLDPATAVADAIRARLAAPIGAAGRQAVASAAETP